MSDESPPERHKVGSTDYTIATSFGSPERVRRIRQAIADLDKIEPEITRDEIDTALGRQPDLKPNEAEAVLVGLLLNDAAAKADFESPFIDATFRIDVPKAVEILREQAIACHALNSVEPNTEPRDPDPELVVTTPPEIAFDLPDAVDDLAARLRTLILDADAEVRIANPYFDADQRVIDYIASLPRRGVKTRVLTREVVPGSDRYTVLKSVINGLTPAEREYFEIAELFSTDASTGTQEYATHAKTIIVDDVTCYLGSANLTATSLSRNFEIGVLLKGEQASVAKQVFDAVFEQSTQINLS